MITFRSLYDNELEKWFDFLVDNIFTNDTRELFSNQWNCDPYKDINGIFVAVDKEGEFLSTLRVFIRDIYINGTLVSCAGIGSVGTKEEFRGKNLSTTLFEMSLKYMKDRNIHVSYLLCGEHNEKFYNKQGYSKSPYIKNISKINKACVDTLEYNLRDVNFQGDIILLSHIYQKFSGSFNGTIVRSLEYWKNWIVSNKSFNYKIVSDTAGKEIAYICYEIEDNTIYVLEFGCLPEFIHIFDSVIVQISKSSSADILKVVYQLPINSKMPIDNCLEPCCIMYKLITPFSQVNMNIDSTDKLLGTLKGDGEVSRLLLWSVDNI